jgi:hypothetical protein
MVPRAVAEREKRHEQPRPGRQLALRRTAPESFSGWVGRTTVWNFKTAMWRAAGYQPHLVCVGDMWHQMNRLGPSGMHLSIAADLYDVADDPPKTTC